MKNDKSPDQPPPVRLDQHAVALWEKLRAAVEAEEDWLALQVELRRLAAQIDGVRRRQQPELTAPFRNVMPHFREVIENWEEQRQLMKLTIQGLAWDFTAHAFDLRDGNRVRFDDCIPQSMIADRLLCASARFADLALEGRLLNEDGSEGKDGRWISLLRTPWCKIQTPATRRPNR